MSFAAKFPGFRLRLTRWGLIFLVAVLVLGFAAMNAGNNALMALLGLALASYVVSGAWSRQVLGKIEITAKLSGEFFAGRPALAEVEISNRSKLLPAYGLVVRDAEGQALLCEALLPPSSTRRRAVEVVFEDRGWRDLGPWRLEVLLPLGFFLKSKELLRDTQVLVYPRLLRHSSIEALQGGGGRSDDGFVDGGREGDVVQLRPYRDGDDRRQLHWKQTARQQRPIVVDRQKRAERPVYLVVDPRVQDPEDPEIRARFEHMVSEVATGAVHRLGRGESVGLVVGRALVTPVRSPSRAARLLRPLAEVEPLPADAPAPTHRLDGPWLAFSAESST
jgi:uncharacterized protein (DUF58 family)